MATQVFLVSGTSYSAPAGTYDVAAIGGGQGGGILSQGAGVGGKYCAVTGEVHAASTIAYAIGAGGALKFNTAGRNNGGNTSWQASPSVLAPGGGSATTPVGTVQNAGGNGGAYTSGFYGGAGGGGAGGPGGAGKTGGNGNATGGGGGGGGAGGGSATNGSNAVLGVGGAGGLGPAGTSTGGGGNGGNTASAASAGSAGQDMDATHGAGGGGGGGGGIPSGTPAAGGTGGAYGGGGGEGAASSACCCVTNFSNSGAGYQGLIYLNITASGASTSNFFLMF